jgi:hypothetical protein
MVPLAEGNNDFFFVAHDRDDEIGNLDYRLVRDSQAPTISILEPRTGQTLFAATLVVDLGFTDQLSGIDTASLALTANGEPVSPSACLTHADRAIGQETSPCPPAPR